MKSDSTDGTCPLAINVTCSAIYSTNPAIAAVRQTFLSPSPIRKNRAASNTEAYLIKKEKISPRAAMMKQAHDAEWHTVRAATSLDKSGRNRSFRRDVGLGVESESPRVCIPLCDFCSEIVT